MRARRAWIIGYDIASPRRLRRVARLLERRAVRIQYSLFAGCWTEAEFERLWKELAALIHPRRDDVRAWPVPEPPEVTTLGQGLPDGVWLGEGRVPGLQEVLGFGQGEGRPRARRRRTASAGASTPADASGKLLAGKE
ncbi:CRISPR-associated endonuclease Cas2 [Caldovatus aquaticus]|uniref:CRISPR-associated endoribonuclease Cas2 n=1 Tax=Caldovatus aquaticus TaxID=2865671 RepID=A0ABS7F073_9PROT|nr:CRISPR-associated endonuclease Cas2 [Caldovatus aquaticus]MBW8269027.1 CRISPR-associated endonuclease Cas2 [Caldovatus aquaticus]